MEQYQERFIQEYKELKERTIKLYNMLNKYALGELDFEPKCSHELLTTQHSIMCAYMSVLEERARIEGINLS